MKHSRFALRNLSVRLLQAAIAMVTSVIVARVLGAEGRGVVALLLIAPFLGARVLSCGTEAALVVFFTRVERRELLSHAFAVVMLAGVAGMAAVLALQSLGALPGRAYTPLDWRLLAILMLPLQLIILSANGLLRGAGRLGNYDRGLLVGPLSQLPLVLLLVVILGRGVPGALAASVGALTMTATYLVTRAAVVVSGVAPIRPRLSGKLLRFGMKEHAGNLAQYLNLRLDLLLVGIFLGAREAGLYAVATSVAEVVWFVPDALGTVLLPRIARGAPETARAAASRACRIALGASTVLAGLILVLGGVALPLLYGADFAPAWEPLAWLLAGVVLLSVSKILSKHLSGTGHPGLAARASLVSLTATVVLDLALIPVLGLAGAALATTIAYGVHAAVCTLGFRSLTGASLSELAVPGRDDLERVSELIRDILAPAPVRPRPQR